MGISSNFSISESGVKKLIDMNGRNVTSVTTDLCDFYGAGNNQKTRKHWTILLGTFYLYTDVRRLKLTFQNDNSTSDMNVGFTTLNNSTTSGNVYLNYPSIESPGWWSGGNDDPGPFVSNTSHINREHTTSRWNIMLFFNAAAQVETATRPPLFPGGFLWCNWQDSGGYTNLSTTTFRVAENANEVLDTFDRGTTKVVFRSASNGNLDYNISVYSWATGGLWNN